MEIQYFSTRLVRIFMNFGEKTAKKIKFYGKFFFLDSTGNRRRREIFWENIYRYFQRYPAKRLLMPYFGQIVAPAALDIHWVNLGGRYFHWISLKVFPAT